MLGGTRVARFSRLEGCDELGEMLLNVDLLKAPRFADTDAMAWFVFKQQKMVFSRLFNRGFLNEGHRRVGGVRWEKSAGVEECSEGDVPQVRRRVVEADNAVG